MINARTVRKLVTAFNHLDQCQARVNSILLELGVVPPMRPSQRAEFEASLRAAILKGKAEGETQKL